MYIIKGNKVEKIEAVTFADLYMKESDIEEILRCNIDMLCGEEESMLIVGRQVKNEKLGRSDLTAVDNNGSLVLIEIKRDMKDFESKKEAIEFQAIRYAASYATIEAPEELVEKVFAPYIEKYSNEFEIGELTTFELGIRKLNEFLEENQARNDFNKKQKIILAASDYGDQTLSAVAWLNNNGVDMYCFKLVPFKVNDQIIINAEKVLPVVDYDEYYVNLLDKTIPGTQKRKAYTRRSLPKIDAMLDWGIVKPGDIIMAKNGQSEAELLENGNILLSDGRELSMQMWLKEIYGWASIETYAFAVDKESGKTLKEIRKEYMDKQALKVIEDDK